MMINVFFSKSSIFSKSSMTHVLEYKIVLEINLSRKKKQVVDMLPDEVSDGTRSALKNYFAVTRDKKPSRSRVASTVEADGSGDIDALWAEHERIRGKFHDLYFEIPEDLYCIEGPEDFTHEKPPFSYLDLKLKLADNLFEDCVLCENRCHVNRNCERGLCGVKNARITSEFMHMGEEAQLVPSHTIFFAGCNFKCVYCQNWDISQEPGVGRAFNEKDLAARIDERRRRGSRNVNFVGGEPTPNLSYIMRTMSMTQENIPVVWNSNFYMSSETMHLLDGFADLFLTDFKYGNDDCAMRLSGIKNYWKTVTRNHKMAWNAGDMIVRHLILPNHVECCSKPILKWISRNLGPEIVLNIMGQYRPVYRASEHAEISRFPFAKEVQDVVEYAENLGFLNLI